MIAITNLDAFLLIPFQIIHDLAEQHFNGEHSFKNLVFEPLCDLNTTNDWINAESLGNPTAIRAKRLTKVLCDELHKKKINRLEIHIYLNKTELSSDNLFSLLFLKAQLEEVNLNFYLDSEMRPSLEEKISCIEKVGKGIINLKTAAGFSHTQSRQETTKSLLIQRESVLRKFGFINPEIAFEKRENAKNMVSAAIGYAWTCLKAGAYEIGCRVLQRSIACDMTMAEREHLFMHLQLIRFLSHQYIQVTNEPFPEHFQFLQKNDEINLYFIKAYCATLSRNLSVAEMYFQKANITKDMPIQSEAALYQLNLHALFLVLKGDIEAAFASEIKIKEYIHNHNIKTLGLKYVNFINIARIHKKQKRFNESLTYYTKAYHEIKEGGFADSDLIYYHMNLGSLYEACGEDNKALQSWLNAALFWLTCDNPYALAWRPRLILCQEKIADILKPLDRVRAAAFLSNKMKELLAKADMELDISAASIQFVNCQESRISKRACLVTGQTMLFHCESFQFPKRKLSGHYEQELEKLLSAVLRKMFHLSEEECVLMVPNDDMFTCPASIEDCLRLAVLSDCDVVYFNGKRIVYNALEKAAYLEQVKLKLSNAIETIQFSVQGIQLLYKRSFFNKLIKSSFAVKLLTQLDKDKTIMLGAVDFPSLLPLMSEKVVSFT